jgi:hypothetical protein
VVRAPGNQRQSVWEPVQQGQVTFEQREAPAQDRQVTCAAAFRHRLSSVRERI